ncbi:glycosyltransferase family 2 protein [Nocardioides zhouii]|uniref:glycosyltransferase family 2 protein n=1 Tax=Nocardioides zhouii TaxID=1168729 RepID=UPI0013EC3739|nr:glycosyltransferase family 2 protein [Nocardioides zhouii]
MITTVSTVKDDNARLQRWIDRNFAAGVDRMLVFVDDRDDAQTAALLNARAGVVAVDAGTWWGDDFPSKLNARQRINANAALSVVRQIDPRGWMFHIDGDEVLHLDKERLLGLADDVEAVQLSPLEALSQWEWPDDEVTLFKRLLTDAELNLLHLLGRLDRPENNAYFRGHTAGKAGLRVSADGWLEIHRVVDDSRTPIAAHRASWLQVLHYESHTLEEFVRKWSNHTTSGHRLVARPGRRRLASAMTAKGWDEWPAGVADRVRRELFAATALDDREGLKSLGLLVAPVMPLRAAEPAQDVLHLDQIEQGLSALASTDRSRFRLDQPDASAD